MSAPGDLVARLNAAIDEVEKDANERHYLGCSSTDPCYEPPYEAGPDYSLCDCRQLSVLRLCQAHRDLIDEWRQAAQIRDYLAVEDEGSDKHWTAVGIAAGLWAAVNLLARGYGVEDTDG